MSLPPMVSVIVPVRNRPEEIVACLDAVQAQRYEGRVETIVVDDASTDATASVVAGRADGERVRLIRSESRRGPSASRNLGATSARGEILAFVDSDCAPDPRWIDLLAAELSAPGTVAAGGEVKQWPQERWLQRYEAACSPLTKGVEPGRVVPGTDLDFLPSCNLAVRKDAFVSIGGFDPTMRFGEDVDLVWRLCRIGEVRYRPEARVSHRGRDRLGAFLRDRVSYTEVQAVFLDRFPDNRRSIVLSWRSASALAIGSAAAGTGRWMWVPAAVLPIVAGAFGRRGDVAALPTLRSDVSALYRAARIVTRYDGVAVAAAGAAAAVWWRPGLVAVWGAASAMVASGIVEWVRRRPRMGPLTFISAHVLDDLAAGAGTLLGCVRRRTIRPLVPRVALDRKDGGFKGSQPRQRIRP